MGNRFDVQGRVALITGGRRGIGRALALGLSEAGARVAIVAHSADPGDLSQHLGVHGTDWLYLQADLLNRTSRKGLVDRVVDHFGQVDILVNNAGVQSRSPAQAYPQDQWDGDLELMLTAVMDLSQQAMPHMAARGWGRIIQIASISSFQGARNIAGYATAKHGLIGLTKCLSNEWASLGINVNAIAPGLIATGMADHVFNDPTKAEELRGRIPSGRFGIPEDLVGPLLFLASEACAHVHGSVILVDGGWMGR